MRRKVNKAAGLGNHSGAALGQILMANSLRTP